MRKIVFTTFLVFGLFGFTENIFGDGYRKWVDEKGTIHFSDNRTSLGNQEKGASKEDGMEVLKRTERMNRPAVNAVSDGKTLKIYGLSETPSGSRSTSSQTPSRSTSSSKRA